MNMTEEELQQVLDIINEATNGATKGCGLKESVMCLISQRDNARAYADIFRQKLKELGYEYV